MLPSHLAGVAAVQMRKPALSATSKDVLGYDVFECDFWAAPLHLHHGHWVLAVWDLLSRRVTIYDSMNADTEKAGKGMVRNASKKNPRVH